MISNIKHNFGPCYNLKKMKITIIKLLVTILKKKKKVKIYSLNYKLHYPILPKIQFSFVTFNLVISICSTLIRVQCSPSVHSVR